MIERTKAELTRERLLDATLDVMRGQGVAALTLENVAQRAGISKGGLLHHFHSKDDLIEALIQRLFADFGAKVEEAAALEPRTPGRWARAYIRVAFTEDALGMEIIGLLAPFMVASERMMNIVREDYYLWQDRLASDGLSPARAWVVQHAADARWTDRMIGIDLRPPATSDVVLDELLALATPGETEQS
jgi:AcrR family transcriptional regulator